MAKTYILGNWKMNQSVEEIKTFFNNIDFPKASDNSFFGIAPQAIHFGMCQELSNGISIGVQNVSRFEKGAHTGEISPVNLKEMNCGFVIIGHSERRAIYNETDSEINEKVILSKNKGLLPIVCIGETLEQRETGDQNIIVSKQLSAALSNVEINNKNDIVIAYEPVWAIGTGKTASPEQAQEIHAHIRSILKEQYGEMGSDISILYGGSVKPSNINDLLSKEDINGALVGGASLKSEDFTALCIAAK
jgi:triosephosphate isomerase